MSRIPDMLIQGRPFRLWDCKAKKFLPYRCFSIYRNCHRCAMVMARWSRVGTTLEVIDVRTSRMCGQYTRGVNAINFRKGNS